MRGEIWSELESVPSVSSVKKKQLPIGGLIAACEFPTRKARKHLMVCSTGASRSWSTTHGVYYRASDQCTRMFLDVLVAASPDFPSDL